MNENTALIPILSVVNLSKSFGQQSVLQNVSFDVQPGELVALLGENGAGKTTLMSVVIGMAAADSGHAVVLGCKPGSAMAKQSVGVMLQAASLPEKVKVIEQLTLFASYYPNSAPVEQVLETAQLTAFSDQFIGVLSGGQKQRLLFALAIIGQPKLLVLDEPTVGLDTDARNVFWQCIAQMKAKGIAILLTTHYLDEADTIADRVVLLHRGTILANETPNSLKQRVAGKRVSFATQDIDRVRILFSDLVFESCANGSYQTLSQDADQLVVQLVQSGIPFSQLQIAAVSLEEAIQAIPSEATQQHTNEKSRVKEHAA